jgi:hypothetical protein
LEKEQRSAIHALTGSFREGVLLKIFLGNFFSVILIPLYQPMRHNLVVMNQPKKAVNDPGDIAD